MKEAHSLPVTIAGVQLVSETEGVAEVTSEPQTIDVLQLRNGKQALLGTVELPAGSYHQVRLIVEEAEITFDGGEIEYPVMVPSGSQTGLKINVEPALVVEEGATSDLIVDFDARLAVVENPPGSGSYILKPTAIRAVSDAGGIAGTVVSENEAGSLLPVPGVEVTVREAGGDPVTTSTTEEDGSFEIVTLPEGAYELEFSLGEYFVVVTDVEVSAGETTVVGEVELEAGVGADL